jgi:hypothetical protein
LVLEPEPPAQATGKAESTPALRAFLSSLETVGKILPVAVLTLPVSGALYRWISFSNGSAYVPGTVAAQLPVTELALIAATDVLAFPALLLAVLAPMGYVLRSETDSSADLTSLYRSRKGAAYLAGAILVLLVWSVVTGRVNTFVGLVASALTTVFLYVALFVLARPPYPVGWARVVAVFGAFALYAGIVFGLAPNGAGTTVSDIVPSPDGPLAPGRYVVLGELDDRVWLLPCVDLSAAVQVPIDAIASRTSVRIPEPTRGRFDPDLNHIWPDPPGFTPRCESTP